MTSTIPALYAPPAQHLQALPDEIAARLVRSAPGVWSDPVTADTFVEAVDHTWMHWPSPLDQDAPDWHARAAAAAERYAALGGRNVSGTGQVSAQTFGGRWVEGVPVRRDGNIARVRDGDGVTADESFDSLTRIEWADPPLVLGHAKPWVIVGEFRGAQALPGVRSGPLVEWQLADDLPDELRTFLMRDEPALSIGFVNLEPPRREAPRNGVVRQYLTHIKITSVAAVAAGAYGAARLHRHHSYNY